MSQLQILLTISLSVMELSWLYPWLALLARATTGEEHLLKPGVAFALFFLPLFIVHLLNRVRIAQVYQRAVIGALILLSVLFLIHAQVYPDTPFFSLRWLGSALSFEIGLSREMFLMLAIFVLFWRGLSMSRGLFITEAIGFKFRLGILLLIVLLVVQALNFRADMSGWIVSLFLCGLISGALARIRDGAPAGQENERFSLSWLFLLLLGGGGTLLLGLLLSLLFTTETIISRALRPVFDVLGTIFLYALFIISYVLVTAFNALIQAILKAFPLQEPVDIETLTLSPPGMFDLGQQTGEVMAPPVWLEWIQQGAIALTVLGIFVLLLMAVRRWQLRSPSEADMWRDSVWSSGNVGQGILQGLRNGLNRLAGLWSGRAVRRAYSAATVRNIYASLLALAAKYDVPRPPAKTPFEHLPALQRAFPGWDSELHALTKAYIEAHYGRVPDTEAELQALRDAWQRLKNGVTAQFENEKIT